MLYPCIQWKTSTPVNESTTQARSQVMLLWTLAYVIHPQWIIPLGLEILIGVER